MPEGYTHDTNYEDPYRPQFLPEDEHLDAFPEDERTEVDNRLLSEWERAYQKAIVEATPDELLPTAEEEKQLAARIQMGLNMEKELLSDGPSGHDRAAKEALVQDGVAARDELVLRSLRLAAWFVRATMDFRRKERLGAGKKGVKGAIYSDLSKLRGGTIDYSDRMQLASIGLIKAAARYKGEGRFSTLAMYNMENELSQELVRRETLPFRLPSDVSQDIRNVSKTRGYLTGALGRQPTDEEVAHEMLINEDKVGRLDQLEHGRQRISLEDLASRYLEEHDGGEVWQDEAEGIEELLPDPSTELTIEDEAALDELERKADQILAALSEREQLVIELRFGLAGGEPMTLEAVGQEIGLTRERVRQIEARALSILRRPYSNKGLDARAFISADDDPMYGMRAELAVSDRTEAQLGLTKPDKTTRPQYPWRKKKDSEQPAIKPSPNRTYTLAEFRKMEEERLRHEREDRQ